MNKIAFTFALVIAVLGHPPAAVAAGTWTWPVRGEVITPYRNGDDPYAAGQHRGIDIASPVGTPVFAAAAGTIVHSGVVGSSGLTVSERTADGRFELSYLHLSAAAVHAGAHVAAGERVGAVGTSGSRSAEEPHLHFGVREAGDRQAYLDPLSFLAPLPVDTPAPRPAPLPVPASSPARPSAAPAPAPALRPLPLLQPAHGAVPREASHPVASHHAPVRHGVLAPHAPRLVVRASPVAAASPVHDVVPSAHPHASDAASPDRHAHGSRPAPAPLGAAPAPASHSPEPAAQPRPEGRLARPGGVDLGWLAACLGLVVAAALLANPERARGAARHSRAGLGALLRPLLRRT